MDPAFRQHISETTTEVNNWGCVYPYSLGNSM